MKKRFRGLATAGVASVLAIGLSACGTGDEPSSPGNVSDEAHADQCRERIGTGGRIDDNIQRARATPVPMGVSGTAPEEELKDPANYAGTNTYLVGWRNPPKTFDPVDNLDDVALTSVVQGQRDDCHIMSLTGEKLTGEGHDKGWQLYSFTTSDKLPDEYDSVYLSFENPYHDDRRVIIRLSDMTDSSIKGGDLGLLRVADEGIN